MLKIFWGSTPLIRMTVEQLTEKLNGLLADGYTEATHKFDIRAWAGKKLRLDDRRQEEHGKIKGCMTLYINENELCRYYAVEGDTEDKIKFQGVKAGSLIKDTFKVIEGKRMRDVFGTTSSDDLMDNVPKPLYFIQKDMQFTNIDSVKCIDMTAMYPSCAAGQLPTTKDMKELSGRVKPTAEYPFAFYLKSRHTAEYGVFDTHDYVEGRIPRELRNRLILNSDYKPRYKTVADNDEITWLMKPAKAGLERLFGYFYEKRVTATDEYEKGICKLVMNAGIGTLHRNPARRYGNKQGQAISGYYHLAAILLGRANQKMIETYKKVTMDGNLVLQMIVDSIIYQQSNKDNIGIPTKKMGEFHIECENAIYRSNGNINQYVIADENGNIIKTRCSGVKNPEIEKLEDIDKYVKEGERL